MSNYKFYYYLADDPGCVEIPAEELQWIANYILNEISKNNKLRPLESDALYNMFEAFEAYFNALFDRVCYRCDLDGCNYIKSQIYKQVKKTVFKIVQDDLEKRRG